MNESTFKLTETLHSTFFLLFIFALGVIPCSLQSQEELIDTWTGMMKVQRQQMRITLHLSEEADSLVVKGDMSGRFNIPFSIESITNDSIAIAQSGNLFFSGKLSGKDTLVGRSKLNNISVPVVLTRWNKNISRPQEPIPPFPYDVQEITFRNVRDSITLAGTLTTPKDTSDYPIVILISGSGPQNRNSELLGHKPFYVIADHFTRNGIGVLRYDERGVGDSEGKHAQATSSDFAYDVESAIGYLNNLVSHKGRKIGLVGHSEGGMIAPLIASRNNGVDFIVCMAGPAIPFKDILMFQLRTNFSETMGLHGDVLDRAMQQLSEGMEVIMNSKNQGKALQKEVKTYSKENEFGFASAQVIQSFADHWTQYLLRYDPHAILQSVPCPVLAINGSKDQQVLAKENLAGMREGLMAGGNTQYTIKEFPNLNHLFQNCNTGKGIEYAKIHETFSPLVLEYITEWIKGL